jgi:hypothetical protein
MQRHRHQEFIRFLNAVERAVPAGKLIHAIADNYATHKHPKVREGLVRHRSIAGNRSGQSGSLVLPIPVNELLFYLVLIARTSMGSARYANENLYRRHPD